MITIENFDKIRYADICKGWHCEMVYGLKTTYQLTFHEIGGDTRRFIIDRRDKNIVEHNAPYPQWKYPIWKKHLESPASLIERIRELYFFDFVK